jgi:hypothetical protein
MNHSRTAGVAPALCAALLTLVAGCGVVTNSNGPQPVASDPSSGSTTPAAQGLQLGYIWQAGTQNLFPVLGVSGAAHYGEGILPGGANVVLAAANGSTSASWALLLNKDGTLQELELPANTTNTLTAGVALDASFVFSPTGASAALASVSTGTVLVVSGLPSKAQVATLHVPAGRSLAGVAVSDAGTVLAGLKQAGAAGVQIAVASGTHGYSAVENVQAWGGAAFLPGSVNGSGNEAAVVVDGKSAQVTYIANMSGVSPTISAIATAGLLQSPVGVGVSSDGKWAFVADSGRAQIVRASLIAAGPAPSAIACACSPQQLKPVTGSGLFSVTANVAGQPDWILDTRTQSPRTFFVPAMAVPATSQTASLSAKPQPDRTTR